MKLSSQTLKRIIKEELDHFLLEQKAQESIEGAEQVLDSPKADAVLSNLADKPEVEAALKDFLAHAQSKMNEEKDDGGLYGPEDGNVPAKLAGVSAAAGTLMASPMFASLVINSPAGQKLMSVLSPYIDPALTALGMGGATIAGSVAVAMAIALASNEIGKPK